MSRAVDDRPERAGSLTVSAIAAKQLRADPEQDASAQLQSIPLLLTPGKWLEKRQPRVFELGQFVTCHTVMQQVGPNGLQSRLSCGSIPLVHFV